MNFNKEIEIQLHDSYFVFPLKILIWIPSIILFVFWIIYFLTKQFLFSKRLIWIHIFFTILTSLLIMALPYLFIYGEGTGIPSRYYNYDSRFKMYEDIKNSAIKAFIILLLGQFTYFINITIGLYKGVGK